jgi:hypothetical protein
MMELLKKFNNSHLPINQFFHNHGEELRLLIQPMDSRTHHGNGSIENQRRLWLKKDIITTIIITIKLRILAMKALLKRSMDSHQTTNQYSHSHGEELKQHIQLTDSRTHLSNGSIRARRAWLNTSITTTIITRLKTSVMKASLKKFMDSPPMTNQFSHFHGEELNKPIQRMVSRTQDSNGWLNKTD